MYACYTTAPWRVQIRLHLEAAEVAAALSLAERARSHPQRVPADPMIWIECLAANGRQAEARDELEKLRPEYEGTLPFGLAEEALQANAC